MENERQRAGARNPLNAATDETITPWRASLLLAINRERVSTQVTTAYPLRFSRRYLKNDGQRRGTSR